MASKLKSSFPCSRYFFQIILIQALSCCNKPGHAAAAPRSSTTVRVPVNTLLVSTKEINYFPEGGLEENADQLGL